MSAPNYAGNSRFYLLDRLTQTHPHLVPKVESGELSAHAAAIEAGIRPRTLQMRIDNPQRFVKSMRRNGTPEFVAEVARLLNEGEA